VEGARVGPKDYTFRHTPNVIRCSDLLPGFAAVLSGHIHRHQVLRHDLEGHPLSTPVLYPGSVERTAFAEVDEEKGFILLEMAPGRRGGRLVRQDFVGLPTRPMVVRDLHPETGPGTTWLRGDLDAQFTNTLAQVPEDAVLRVRFHGQIPADLHPVLSVPRLRRVSPPEMNLEVRFTDDQANQRSNGPRAHSRAGRQSTRREEASPSPIQLQMDLT
jgi:DNA repair exonuclease SbcCD nuclease subunit